MKEFEIPGFFDNFIFQKGAKFGLVGSGKACFESRADAEAEAKKLFENGLNWEAPQFYVQRGAEFGYHCHGYRTIGNRDLGIVLTMVQENIFAETHRIGKVKKPLNLDSVGDKEKKELAFQVGFKLHSIPEVARRKPGKNAIFVGSYE